LGRASRARSSAKVVGVTGSVGKTSTKEMLRTVLGAHGRVHAAEASYNNHWGVPLTLARMPRDAEFAVIEIGMNHPGEIAPLSQMARPHVAVVTIVAPAHLEAFENIDGIAHEKAAIFDGLEPRGVAIWNGDLPTSGILQAHADKMADVSVSFGESEGCDMRVTSVREGDGHSVAEAVLDGGQLLYKIDAPGRHFAINGAAVLAVAEVLGLDRALSLAAMGRWHPGAGRGAHVTLQLDLADPKATLALFDDAYNANPASVAASLVVLAAAPVQHDVGRVSKGRRIAVLGDMKELGPTGPELHAGLADLDATKALDKVHCVGPLMRHLYDALPEDQRGLWFETSDDMAAYLPRQLDAGDVVMVKGSLSMRLARVVDAIRNMSQGSARDEAEG
jgi:UDP-N-acetylmuramoyl-tripeptide--D-alanyl-D-alanine ligase